MITRTVCVFCSSSDAVDKRYFRAAEALGEELAARGHRLVYGGTDIGLMGAVARAARVRGAHVVGVVPEVLIEKGIVKQDLDELIVKPDLRRRKQAMEERSDAFIALPGGFGTLEELLEIITLNQLNKHPKPVVLLNVEGFFNPLLDMFERCYAERFVKEEFRSIYSIASTASEALDMAETGKITESLPNKWF